MNTITIGPAAELHLNALGQRQPKVNLHKVPRRVKLTVQSFRQPTTAETPPSDILTC